MLNQISISNYAIVDQLDLDICKGMTVITGETGAGKSIMLDALGLAIGGRADSSCIRSGEDRTEIRACFDLSNNTPANTWLKARDYDNDEVCILRRIITKEGRSRGYINGIPATLSDLKSIGEQLIDIHSQHAHQSLLKKNTHPELLDNFAGSTELSRKVALITKEYSHTKNHLNTLLSQRQEQDERIQLLSYQLQELEQLELCEGEVDKLEQEHKEQSQASSTLAACHQVNQLCAEDDSANLIQQLSICIHQLTDLQIENKAIVNSLDMLASAQIQIEEAVGELNQFIDHFDADPERALMIEERLSAIYDLARKHRIQPEELISKQQQISDELEKIQHHDEQVSELEELLESLQSEHKKYAEKLSVKRTKAAKKLERQVTERIALLGMPKGKFVIHRKEIKSRLVSPQGLEDIEFLVTTNPGQPARPLAKVASGGELSRISLAIQVIIAQTSHTPTLVFDEVDVGIGGGTAETVGNMLREVGESGQVLCVTHQPQVASQGHQHLHVSKQFSKSSSKTSIDSLQGDNRIQEVARMLGGIEITPSTLIHAKEMLNAGHLAVH
ncbi:DNA repair protein RecN [Endozoicomonas sp. (ex Bugula neritina AB1)]|nr:DNA repair protein RecN [Endozoicomonas sp. (ex Bugula neritina AB1)]